MNIFSRDASFKKIKEYQKENNSSAWKKIGDKKTLDLFRAASVRVPAYKDFLKKNKIDPGKIRSFKDFQLVPPMTKADYLRKYPLEKLCFDGTLKNKSTVFTSTSGSTGAPFYFPRDLVVDTQSSIFHETFWRNTFAGGKEKSTLVIDSFGMGVWIGGIITYQAFRQIALSGAPISIITPGINKKEIFEAFKNIAGKFEQVILCGYPPFIKDLIDEGHLHGIDWKKYNIKFLFAAEAFSEKFRDYLMKKVGMKDPLLNISNIYGSADIGTMAAESPLSILIRRIASNKNKVFESIFPGVNKTPTLAQFNPLFVNFEAPEGVILLSGYNILPLIRYSIGDHGGVSTFDDMSQTLKHSGINLKQEISAAKIGRAVSEMPFVYVYERIDLSTKLFGAIIHPEHIKESLYHESLENYLTGKFTLSTVNDKHNNQWLEIHLEMKPNVSHSEELGNRVKDIIIGSLLEKNAEYKNNYKMMPHKVTPKLFFWEYEDPKYFSRSGKQKWVQK
ncbi:MAG TPA: hypothetical protein P5056_03030 [Candidatus Paceibacterota bacterium]|nr:hypothetical protein [Candidatus Paceibacterota bacterium]